MTNHHGASVFLLRNTVSSIQNTVGDKGKVITGVSGGVDSSVVGTLFHRAIGERSRCVFIDHGLLRKNESEEVMGTLKTGLGLNINRFDFSNIWRRRSSYKSSCKHK